MESEIDLTPDLEGPELDERELEVLKLMSSEQNGYFSFQGLRRRLGFHQETLTRTLRRLKEARVIESSPEGYRLRTSNSACSFKFHTNQFRAKPIIEAYLPALVDVTVLFQRLRGRWFSNFRWLGYSNHRGQLSMSWVSEDGRMQLQARVNAGKISILVDSLTSRDDPRLVAAAYQLFDHVSKAAEELVQNSERPTLAN